MRCHLAAQLLGSSLRTHAEQAGWEVDERGDLVGNDDASVASSLDALDLNESEKGVERDEDGAPRGKGWGYIDEDGDAEMQLKAWRKRAARGLDGHHRSSESGNNSAQQESDSGTGTLGIFYISHVSTSQHSLLSDLCCHPYRANLT